LTYYIRLFLLSPPPLPMPPALLIEHWLPIEALGAESQRERGASSALPPLYFLHVWWARRPLTTSRAAILASVLPQWQVDWPSPLCEKFPNELTYHNWFTQLVGILGDPVRARKIIEAAKRKKIKLPGSPYGYPRAFTQNPSAEDLDTLGELLELTWGNRDVTVMDPMAGGGSIPFESLRFGFTTIANELNPVASVILKATLDYPVRFGASLAEDIRRFGRLWADKVQQELSPYFPKQSGEKIFAYLWARTVACPTTGKPVPLSPNWWLAKGDKPAAIRLIADPASAACRFEIVIGRAAVAEAKPDDGTIKGGNGRSPWTNEAIDGEYIKREAQAGRMGQTLYAVVVKNPRGFEFRAPTQSDLAGHAQAQSAFEGKQAEWISKGILVSEGIGVSNYDRGHRLYGVYHWSEFFSTRELFALTTCLA
jgi:adenine-specific DNA methylase